MCMPARRCVMRFDLFATQFIDYQNVSAQKEKPRKGKKYNKMYKRQTKQNKAKKIRQENPYGLMCMASRII